MKKRHKVGETETDRDRERKYEREREIQNLFGNEKVCDTYVKLRLAFSLKPQKKFAVVNEADGHTNSHFVERKQSSGSVSSVSYRCSAE